MPRQVHEGLGGYERARMSFQDLGIDDLISPNLFLKHLERVLPTIRSRP